MSFIVFRAVSRRVSRHCLISANSKTLRRYRSSWHDRIAESDILFSKKQDVSRHGMLDLLCACNTIIRPTYCEDSPYAEEATITIYGKPGHGKSIKDLKEIVESIDSFKNIVGFLSVGYPQLLKVKFPYLQKYKKEFEDCMTMVVEMPCEFDMLSQVTQNSNLLIKDFDDEKIYAYADLGEIELSKVKCVYADCYSGGDVVCRNHFHGSGTFKTMLKGGVYFKKMQGVNFSIFSEEGNLVTDAVYCDDMVYCAEKGDVIAGIVHSSGCHFETYNGEIKIGSLTTDNTLGRITESGNFDIVLEKTTNLRLENKTGNVTLKLNPSVEVNMLINSKSSAISSELKFDELEKKNDPIRKYEVVKGKIGENGKDLMLFAHQGHVSIQTGDWMSSLNLKRPK